MGRVAFLDDSDRDDVSDPNADVPAAVQAAAMANDDASMASLSNLMLSRVVMHDIEQKAGPLWNQLGGDEKYYYYCFGNNNNNYIIESKLQSLPSLAHCRRIRTISACISPLRCRSTTTSSNRYNETN